MGLRICREYGQPPNWWFGLDSGTQALLIADLERRNKRPPAAVGWRRNG